jgi:hypothetical protein
MQKVIAFVGLAAFALVCLLATASGGKDDSAVAASPFKGRVTVVGTTINENNVYVLLNAKVERLGERYFLVGTAASSDDPDAWQMGKVTWVALDVVFEITEFASVEEFEKAYTRGQKTSGQKTP